MTYADVMPQNKMFNVYKLVLYFFIKANYKEHLNNQMSRGKGILCRMPFLNNNILILGFVVIHVPQVKENICKTILIIVYAISNMYQVTL